MEVVKVPLSSNLLQTARDKRWLYEEYYLGDKDSEGRKNGQGENHWTGAESIEWYTGTMFRDTMHGEGDYRWRYKDPDGSFVTYEGRFFANHLHGYGVMSYPDGQRFKGLFFNDVRWGPGEERTAGLRSCVGLWRGTKLARLCWCPNAPSITPDLDNGPSGAAYLDQFRIVLMKNIKIIDESNAAVDILQKFGADPETASKMWTKLYPKYCTDMNSALFHKDLFDYHYYNGRIHTVEEAKTSDNKSVTDEVDKISYFAWNNNPIILHMMKHSYQHDHQRARVGLDLERLLNGPRTKFRPAAKHEYDCRSLLMASYLGRISDVVQLVNEEDVFPDVADSQGNTALIYSVVGDQVHVIQFLIEAGASVNSCNDSCCTPLSVALMRYLCVAKDIPPTNMPLLPLKSGAPPCVENRPIEWHITRQTIEDNKERKISTIKPLTELSDDVNYDSDEDYCSDERQLFLNISKKYLSNIMSICYATKTTNTEDKLTAKPGGNRKIESKVSTTQSRIDSVSDNARKSTTIIIDKEKSEALSRIQLTIAQLLKYGANPKLVKVPQPAIVMAIKAGQADLIHLLVSNGADVNETFPGLLDFSVLDVVVSEPFTDENLEIIRALLEAGAEASHRLKKCHSAQSSKQSELSQPSDTSDDPTLLHIVITRKAASHHEEQIQLEIIKLLLLYNADPNIQFKGRSAIDYAMSKKLEFLDVFIKSSSTNLNSIINQQQHTILVKLFSKNYFNTILGINKLPTLTNLLLLGADPLIECYDGDDRYENLFEFANKTFNDIAPRTSEHSVLQGTNIKGKAEKKSKDVTKNKKTDVNKTNLPNIKEKEALEYTESLGMMRECSRLLHVRWLQAQLLKELIDVIYRFNHRHWTMIIKEHKNGHNVGLWMTPSRCLEIWDILQSTNNKKYKDENILRELLRIVQFYYKRVKAQRAVTVPMSAIEKDIIQTDVRLLMREHKVASELMEEIWKSPCVKPELAFKAAHKFKICFECGLRLREDKMTCDFCKLVSFCNMSCMFKNSERRVIVHPCSKLLLEKYSLPPEDLYA